MTNAVEMEKTAAYSRIQVEPVAGVLGAEIAGVDLAEDLDDKTIAEIRDAWLEYLVVFFRDQDITPAQHLAFAKRFGDIVEYPLVDGLDEFPEIVPVVKIDQRVIGNGKPGPVTKKVVKAYKELTKVSGERIAKR